MVFIFIYLFKGGSCQVVNGTQQCLCPYGYSGAYCQNIDCNKLSCQNGGFCQSANGVQTCVCPSGYTGTLCQTCNYT